MATFARGGVHPPTMKLTAGDAIVDIDLPRRVVLSMAQSLGKPATPVVAKGDRVSRYDIVGQASGPISANVHTPITGTVTAVEPMTDMTGHRVTTVVVEASDDDHFADLQSISDARPIMSLAEALDLEPQRITDIVSQAGIVGLGGATFPTAVKLSDQARSVHPMLLINGSECEPYLTCDDRIMRELAESVVDGIALMMRALTSTRAIVGIEDNKPQAIETMTAAAERYQGIEVVTLTTRYPQGGEKMLTKALTGREIAPGKLPITAGVVIQNVATALAVYQAVVWGIPLVERVVTISGEGAAKRGNYRVPVGTPMSIIDEIACGSADHTVRLVAGGPMMGRALAGIEGGTTKGFGGLLYLTAREAAEVSTPVQPCVRCGRCVDSCPMGLEPWLLARLSQLRKYDDAVAHHLRDCMECGCCSYSCIAHRPLVDLIRVAKMSSR